MRALFVRNISTIIEQSSGVTYFRLYVRAIRVYYVIEGAFSHGVPR